MIKAVLFDMDGIMFDTEKIMSEGWQEAAKQLGFILTDQQMNQMRGSSKARNTALFKDGTETVLIMRRAGVSAPNTRRIISPPIPCPKSGAP